MEELASFKAQFQQQDEKLKKTNEELEKVKKTVETQNEQNNKLVGFINEMRKAWVERDEAESSQEAAQSNDGEKN